MKKYFINPYQMWVSFGLLTFVILQLFALPIIWEKHHYSIVVIFVSLFTITCMLFSGYLIESLTKKGKEDLLVFTCGVFVMFIIILFGSVRLSAQNIDVNAKNNLTADFKKFVDEVGCSEKSVECEVKNNAYIQSYNAKYGTNHRTLWDLYVNMSAIELQRVLLTRVSPVVNGNNITTNSNGDKFIVAQLNFKIDSLTKTIDTLKVEKRNILVKNMQLESLVNEQNKTTIKLLPNDVLITHKGLYINTRNDMVITQQFVEENVNNIQKVSKNTFIYKPSGNLDESTIISNAHFHRKRILEINWDKVAKAELSNNISQK